MKAQASRGAAFGCGGGLLSRTRRLLPLFIPLFLVSLRRADALVEAMEARCYMGGKGRSHLICLRAQPVDYVALALSLAISLLALKLGTATADARLWSWLALRL
jgi:energy-coupling factor transport system permease protein